MMLYIPNLPEKTWHIHPETYVQGACGEKGWNVPVWFMLYSIGVYRHSRLVNSVLCYVLSLHDGPVASMASLPTGVLCWY